MAEYGRFAEVYDLFMEDIPYAEWAEKLTALLRSYGVPEGLVLELGCGTGTMTELLARAGYDMTGIDVSSEMLQEALQKRDVSGLPILYLNQDMREFELYGTMAAIVSVCDTMNYLTDRADFVRTLKLVNNYLDPDGVFIFDLKTEHFYRDVLGARTEAVSEEDAAYIWENDYDEEARLNRYLLTLFEKRPDGLFERSEELHEQRAYRLPEIREMAEEAGLRFVTAYGEDAGSLADETKDERIYVVLREHGKQKAGAENE